MSAMADLLNELQRVFTTICNAQQTNNIQYLKPIEFRIIINSYKKFYKAPEEHTEIFTQLSDLLSLTLTSGQLTFDCQIVASIAYCLTLTYLNDSKAIIETFVRLLSNESLKTTDVKKYKVCLCHGILQCNNEFWIKTCNSLTINNLLNNEICPIVFELCFEYNSVCLISFKVLVNLIKKINTINNPDEVELSEKNCSEIMNIVMCNWENPLSGVREQNLLVFEQLLIANKDLCQPMQTHSSMTEPNDGCSLLHLILTEQSWMMKSKYFLLSAVLRTYGVNKVLSIYKDDIITGLLTSLNFTQLVSAGCDLYQIIISGFTLEQWQKTFVTPILDILTQSSCKLPVENVMNYWLPYTVKKYPQSLTCLLDNIPSEQIIVNLFPYMSLMKLARKEGCDIANWENLKKSAPLIPGLVSDCDKTRSQTFYLVCVASKLSVPPSDEEVNLVKMFLHQNVNNDNAAMRQNMLNAFAVFIVRLKESSLKEIKSKKINDGVNSAVDKCLDFIEWLYEFIINNFQFDCNYQRKYASVQMYNIILSSFCSKFRNSDLKENIILNIGESKNKWKFTSIESQNILMNNIYDPADDIRSISSQILISYFNIEMSEVLLYKELLRSAITLCQNPLFYQAESGSLLLQTVLTLLSNSSCCVKEDILHDVFVDCESVIDYLIKSVEEQFEEFSKDMLRAVTKGCSLYGILDALEKLFSQDSSRERQITDVQIRRIIALIENIVSLLIKVLCSKSDTSSDFAPSFGEMGMAIASLVQQSSATEDGFHARLSDYDLQESNLEDLQLTPAQQLVLNCIWHNMKVCCNIASTLTTTTYLSVSDAKRCMDLLCLVLCKCRHKGAIESAGLAIYHATKCLTASNDLEFRDIPRKLIKQFLTSLVSANSTTISRRSAGLAILVHRIAAGDMEQGKPLLHICVSRFIEICEDFEEPTEPHLADLPQSQALHFLQTLVQDSSLRQEMAKYIVQISLVCFTNLGSSIWTLRNAALQLFGALLPKLTGQKKLQEAETHCYHFSIEELYFHVKPLFDMIIQEFSCTNASNSLRLHSRMMPYLTLLSNLTVGFQSILNVELSKISKQLSDLTQNLFKSEIYNVRMLSAKTNAWFCLPSNILHCVQDRIKEVKLYAANKQSKITNSNGLHGYILNIKYLVDRFNESKIGNNILNNQDEIIKAKLKELKILCTVNQNYLIHYVLFEIFDGFYSKPCLDIVEIIAILNNYPVTSGAYALANFNFQCLIDDCNPGDIVKCIFNSNFATQITYLDALKAKIKTKWCNEYYDLIYVLDDALRNSNCRSQVVELILEIMLEILISDSISELNIIVEVYFDIFYNYKHGLKCSVVVLPVICGICQQSGQFMYFDNLCVEIYKRSSPVHNEDVRMSAAKSLCFILKRNPDSCDVFGSYVWKSAVMLLQDEDKNVRIEASKFVFKCFSDDCDKWVNYKYKLVPLNLPSTIKNVNPFVALELLFETSVLENFMSRENSVLTLWEMFVIENAVPDKENALIDKQIVGILNPFCSDKNNIYEEKTILIDMIQNGIVSLLRKLNEEHFENVKNCILAQTNLEELDRNESVTSKVGIKHKIILCQKQIVNSLIQDLFD